MKIKISGMIIFMIVLGTVSVIAESEVNEECYYKKDINWQYHSAPKTVYCPYVDSKLYWYLKRITNTAAYQIEDIESAYNNFRHGVRRLEIKFNAKVQSFHSVAYSDEEFVSFVITIIKNPTDVTKNTETILLSLSPFFFQFIEYTNFANDRSLQCYHKFEIISGSLQDIPHQSGYYNPVCCNLISAQLADYIWSLRYNMSIGEIDAKYADVINQVKLMRDINPKFYKVEDIRDGLNHTQRKMEVEFKLRFQSGIEPNCTMGTIVNDLDTLQSNGNANYLKDMITA